MMRRGENVGSEVETVDLTDTSFVDLEETVEVVVLEPENDCTCV